MARVLLVYLGASWVVLQVAEILQEALSLPSWLLPATVVLLLAGLVVMGRGQREGRVLGDGPFVRLDRPDELRLRQVVDSVAGQDTLDAEVPAGTDLTAVRRAVEGIALVERDRPAEALALLGQEVPPGVDPLVRWYRARAHDALDQPREALPLYLSQWSGRFASTALFRAARLHEELGQAEQARRAYRDFLTAWRDADPELTQDDQARAALERLGEEE